MRNAFVIAVVAIAVAGVEAAEKLDTTNLPKPLDGIRAEVTSLGEGGLFTIIDVRYGKVGEDIRSNGMEWTLRANQAVAAGDADDFFSSRKVVKFYSVIRGVDKEVGSNRLFAPKRIDFGRYWGEVLAKDKAFSIWMFLERDEAEKLKSDGAVKMVIEGP